MINIFIFWKKIYKYRKVLVVKLPTSGYNVVHESLRFRRKVLEMFITSHNEELCELYMHKGWI